MSLLIGKIECPLKYTNWYLAGRPSAIDSVFTGHAAVGNVIPQTLTPKGLCPLHFPTPGRESPEKGVQSPSVMPDHRTEVVPQCPLSIVPTMLSPTQSDTQLPTPGTCEVTSEVPQAGKWGPHAPTMQPPLSSRRGSSLGLEVLDIAGEKTALVTGRHVCLAPCRDPAFTSWWW